MNENETKICLNYVFIDPTHHTFQNDATTNILTYNYKNFSMYSPRRRKFKFYRHFGMSMQQKSFSRKQTKQLLKLFFNFLDK